MVALSRLREVVTTQHVPSRNHAGQTKKKSLHILPSDAAAAQDVVIQSV
jgi:hypothetical protein